MFPPDHLQGGHSIFFSNPSTSQYIYKYISNFRSTSCNKIPVYPSTSYGGCGKADTPTLKFLLKQTLIKYEIEVERRRRNLLILGYLITTNQRSFVLPFISTGSSVTSSFILTAVVFASCQDTSPLNFANNSNNSFSFPGSFNSSHLSGVIPLSSNQQPNSLPLDGFPFSRLFL